MEQLRKTRVLITNDDGVGSVNLHALALALSEVSDVYVFAPEDEQSGVGHAFTIRRGLRIQHVETVPGKAKLPYEVYSVSGTPADCVKFAVGHFANYGLDDNTIVPEGFDVCFSGVNVGENSGVSSLYSGTVAGAREAALWGVPAVALSLRGLKGNLLQVAIDFARKIVSQNLFKKISKGVFWNVNFPKIKEDEFLGFKACTMDRGMFTDHYDHKDGLWFLDGEKLWSMAPEGSDDNLLDKGYATITPHRIDQTDEESLDVISEMLGSDDFSSH